MCPPEARRDWALGPQPLELTEPHLGQLSNICPSPTATLSLSLPSVALSVRLLSGAFFVAPPLEFLNVCMPSFSPAPLAPAHVSSTSHYLWRQPPPPGTLQECPLRGPLPDAHRCCGKTRRACIPELSFPDGRITSFKPGLIVTSSLSPMPHPPPTPAPLPLSPAPTQSTTKITVVSVWTSCIICRAWCKMNTGAPCSEIRGDVLKALK